MNAYLVALMLAVLSLACANRSRPSQFHRQWVSTEEREIDSPLVLTRLGREALAEGKRRRAIDLGQHCVDRNPGQCSCLRLIFDAYDERAELSRQGTRFNQTSTTMAKAYRDTYIDLCTDEGQARRSEKTKTDASLTGEENAGVPWGLEGEVHGEAPEDSPEEP